MLSSCNEAAASHLFPIPHFPPHAVLQFLLDDLRATIQGLSAGNVVVSGTVERSPDTPLWLVALGDSSSCSHVGGNNRSSELCWSNHEAFGGMKVCLFVFK